jgi:diguanylate cyclase (GGDEF)-like protein/PAS domain S-box-containing protein
MVQLEVAKRSFDQKHRRNIFRNIAEINQFEWNLLNNQIKIEISKKYRLRHHLYYYRVQLNFDDFINLVHPDFQDKIVKQKETILKEPINKEYRLEFRIRYPKQKEYCWISAVIVKYSDTECFGIHVDINELKQAQIKLEKTKEEYEMIIQNTSDLIAKFNTKGELLYASPSYCEAFDINPIEMNTGKNHFIIKTEADWYQRVIIPPYSSNEEVCIRKDGRERWISWSNNAVLKDGTIDYIISFGHDITEIHLNQKRFEYEANHDILTGLFNRRGIYRELAKLSKSKQLVSISIGINNYKHITDVYGHKTGDRLVSQLGYVLAQFHQYGYLVGRMSEVELIILAPNYSEHHSLDWIIHRLIDQLNGNFTIGNKRVYVSSSIGYSLFPEDTEDYEQLISYSDCAMNETKSTLFNKSLRFNYPMYERLNHYVNLSNDLKQCLDQQGIELVYQSIVDSSQTQPKYIETLARWKHNSGNIPPNVFFKIAEETGLIEDLDAYIISKSILNYKNFKQLETYQQVKLTINVSPHTLLKPSFPEELHQIIQNANISCSDICIEISENTFVNNMDTCIKQIAKLKSIGVLVALDDFGSKYSSLSILDEVEFDIIKVDRAFVTKIKQASIQSILKMVKEVSELKRKEVIIEGVETMEQIDALKALGFELIQGYYYSVPGPIVM